jgi:hypothetical protein
MKTSKLITAGILIFALTGLVFTGCKKNNSPDQPVNTQSIQQLTKDEVTVTQASDDALNDANTVLSGGQLKSTEMWPCNATVDSATVANDTITYHITYHGLNCSGTRYRDGQVEIKRKVGEFWGQPGASTTVKLINFRITKILSNKSLTLNGTKVFTNVTGGFLWQLGFGMTSIVHKAVGTLTATFDDNTSRVWNINRQRTFTGNLAQLEMTIDGQGTADGYTNLVVWGTNRNGEAFYTQIIHPVLIKSVCDWDPVSGVKVHQIPSKSMIATITFGYDNNYQLVTNGECPTYYKVEWQKGPNSGTFYLPMP